MNERELERQVDLLEVALRIACVRLAFARHDESTPEAARRIESELLELASDAFLREAMRESKTLPAEQAPAIFVRGRDVRRRW